MAACTFAVGTADTGNTPNTSDAFVPAAGDLLVVFAQGAVTVANPGALTSSTALTFTQCAHTTYAGAVSSVYAFVSDALVSDTSSQTVAFDPTGDTANGSVIFVYRVSGMTKVGLTAVLQTDTNFNGASTLPSVTFANAVLTGNPTLGMLANATNPAAITCPTGWTEPVGGDLGYASPTTGAACFSRDSGSTDTSINWGANSATAWGALMLELDASGAAAITSTPKRLPLVGVA